MVFSSSHHSTYIQSINPTEIPQDNIPFKTTYYCSSYITPPWDDPISFVSTRNVPVKDPIQHNHLPDQFGPHQLMQAQKKYLTLIPDGIINTHAYR